MVLGEFKCKAAPLGRRAASRERHRRATAAPLRIEAAEPVLRAKEGGLTRRPRLTRQVAFLAGVGDLHGLRRQCQRGQDERQVPGQ